MNIEQFKEIVISYLDSMLDKWFGQNTLKDNLTKAAAKTLIKSNINKYDNTLAYFTDSSGNLLVNDFLDNFIDSFEGWQIDLDSFNIPFLPHKILLLGKQDLIELKNQIM